MAEKYWTEEEVVKLTNEKFNGNREQAEFWIIDHDGWLPDENKEEIKKTIKETTKGAGKRKGNTKPREKDEEKVLIIETLRKVLSIYDFENSNLRIENLKIENVQKEISFTIGENHYSLSLIKHRPPKE